MMKMKKITQIGFFVAVTTTLIFGFQNCNQMAPQIEFAEFSNKVVIPPSHPPESKPELTSLSYKVVNKEYVGEIFREIFSSTNPSFNIINKDALIHRWIINRGAQYGLGCDLYSTWGGKDCGGSPVNSNLPFSTPHNTVRESYHIQACENFLGTDIGVSAALEKISRTVSENPNLSDMEKIYYLFYRGDTPSNEIISTLVDLDKSLKDKSVSSLIRWRALLLLVCESPGWQQI